ncbi:MAG: CotH kinase family protein [Bryobacterales bacterium]|nr:CotH kinase family protein [Bryobacterales bacterium]
MRYSLLSVTGCILVWAGAALAQPAHFAFSKDEVHEVKLTFHQADFWQQLTNNYADNEDDVPYIEADLDWGSYSFKRIGVRFKGNSSYKGAQTDKKPFRLKLNEFVKGQKIGGIASFNLSNGWNDPSLIREGVYFNIAQWAGFVGPRSNFAALTINGKFWGLYVLGEVVNGDFLDTYFPGDSKGNLYKAEMGGTLEDKGDDPVAYKTMFEKKSNEELDDWTDVAEFCTVLNRTPVENLKQALDAKLDVDSFLAAMALDNLTVNQDNYTGQFAQNYYIYRRPSDGKFVWILWDPSLAFAAFGGSVTTPVLYSAETATGGGMFPGNGGANPGQPPFDPNNPPQVPPGVLPPGGAQPGQPGPQPGNGGGGTAPAFTSRNRPLFTRMMQVPEYKERYGQIYRWLVSFLSKDQVNGRMQTLHDLIRPWVVRDTNNLSTLAQFDASLDGTISTDAPGAGGGAQAGRSVPLQTLFTQRLDWVRTQVALNPDGSWTPAQ